MREIETDVLVIGTGGAGLYAAVKAVDQGAEVVVWDKGLVGRSGGTVGGAGIAGVGRWSKKGDDLDIYFKDTVLGGSFLNEQPLVRILVEEAERRITELEEWGLKFDRDSDGNYVLDRAGGHSFPRLMAIGDRVGLQMTKILRTQVMKRDITRCTDVWATRLVEKAGKIAGAVGLDLKHGEVLFVNTPSVVLATGGVGQLYQNTSNPVQCTGDGLALAFRAGAEMLNMEQVQFYPSGLVCPLSLRGFILGIQEYSTLYNFKKERFMRRYDPENLEGTTRDKLARAIQAEIDAGRGSEHGGVYLDATDISMDKYGSFEHEMEVVEERGFDLRKQCVEVAPSAHYYMGGVKIGENGETNISGLFAAGEVSSGVQGGNRLSGNSLAGITVFGCRAGINAARYATKATRKKVKLTSFSDEEELHQLLKESKGRFTPEESKQKLRVIMAKEVGVLRNQKGLERALSQLEKMRDDLSEQVKIEGSSLLQNYSVASYLELQNMVDVAELIVRSAISRKESLGAHYRVDYPTLDDPEIRQCIELVKRNGSLAIKKREADMTELTPEEGNGG